MSEARLNLDSPCKYQIVGV